MAEVQPEEQWRADAEARLASLAKPPGALGTLEDWCVTLCVAQKTLRPTVSAVALVFCDVLEVESPSRPVAFASPRTPEGALPPVPTFMGRGTARRPVEPPAPAPGFGVRVNYDPVLDE